MAADGFEQSELLVPRDRLREAGARIDVASPEDKEIRGWDEMGWGQSVPSDLKISDAKLDQYDALVLPGGQINRDKLRTDQNAVNVVKQFLQSGKVGPRSALAPGFWWRPTACAAAR
jgi:protease I